MRYAAIIIDDRKEIADEAIERHSKFLPKEWDIIHVWNRQTKTASEYNALLTSVEFWESYKDYHRVLIFQHDSGLLRQGIEEFLEYDFIGAPIKNIPNCMNGGLSLRNPKAMLYICKFMPYRGMDLDGNEDIYFCHKLIESGRMYPLKETAQKFSVETIFGLGSLGYHAMNKYLSHEQVNQILKQYDK